MSEEISHQDSGHSASSTRGTAVADPRSGEGLRRGLPEKDTKRMDQISAGKGGGTAPTATPHAAGLFDWYKPGQGYWVRACTMGGGALLIAAGANFVWHQFAAFYDPSKPWTFWIQVLPSLLFLIGLGYLLFWFVGRHRRSADFMIATEGEMKKVNWSTRREVIGSTKVVIVFVLLLGIILFGIELIFWSFFSAIGVLKGPSPWQTLFGIGS